MFLTILGLCLSLNFFDTSVHWTSLVLLFTKLPYLRFRTLNENLEISILKVFFDF